MLGLYILGVVGVYLGIGTRCAEAELDVCIEKELSEDTAVRYAYITLLAWPIWAALDLPAMIIAKRFRKKSVRAKLLKEQNEEVEKLLLEDHSW